MKFTASLANKFIRRSRKRFPSYDKKTLKLPVAVFNSFRNLFIDYASTQKTLSHFYTLL